MLLRTGFNSRASSSKSTTGLLNLTITKPDHPKDAAMASTAASLRLRPNLLTLPSELLTLLTYHLHSLSDLYSLSLTSRRLHTICALSRARLPPISHAYHGHYGLPPNGQILLAGTARQLADWAVQSSANRTTLYDTLLLGPSRLLDLATQVSYLHLSDVRALHARQATLVRPAAELVEASCGRTSRRLNWVARGNDLNSYDERDDEFVTCLHPYGALMAYWIYCELFHHTTDSALAGATAAKSMPKPLGAKIREAFLVNWVSSRDREVTKMNNTLLDLHKMWQCGIFSGLMGELYDLYCGGLGTSTPKIERIGLFQRAAMHKIWQGSVFRSIMGELYDLYRGGLDASKPEVERIKLFQRVAMHSGEQTLNLLRGGSVSAGWEGPEGARLKGIQARVMELSREDVLEPGTADEGASDYWWGMDHDVLNA